MKCRNLECWKMAKSLAVDIYGLSKECGARPDYGFLDQIRRSSVSIASNLAEGAERGTPKDSVHFFVMARASAAELLTQIEIGLEAGLLPGSAQSITGRIEEIMQLINGLIRFRRSRRDPVSSSHHPSPMTHNQSPRVSGQPLHRGARYQDGRG
jgi:four helix bundle protein